MTNQPDKKLIRSRFARSLATYSDNAEVQSHIASRLMAELIETAGSEFDQIFEVGCGSGLFTDLIRQRLSFRQLYLNDIVEECASLATDIPGSVFIPGDIETIPQLPSGLDLVVSNAVFQWLHDLPGTVERIANSLERDGLLAFSTFGPNNFAEIRHLTGTSLKYYSLDELKSMLNERFEVISAQEKSYFLQFPEPAAVLRHMKNTGVTAIATRPWTKTTLRDFTSSYLRQFAVRDGVILTYQPIIIVAALK